MYVEELKYSLRWKPVANPFQKKGQNKTKKSNKNLKLTCKLTKQ